jgi:formamidopyrimidine-DNA glycosylase
LALACHILWPEIVLIIDNEILVPELPEVETVKRGIAPHLIGRCFTQTTIRDHRLRWPVDPELGSYLSGQPVLSVERRAKYLLIGLANGYLIVHLGMSGRLYFVQDGAAIEKHSHLDWLMDDGRVLRYTDPRRFGAVIWSAGADVGAHKLLAKLGPEPLAEEFDAEYLFKYSRKRKVPIKSFLMDAHVVVGVGNIYANEALFMAGISPLREAGSVSKTRYVHLVAAVKLVLEKAILQGGTTLKDFVGGDGKPGYFKQELQVYGRGGLTCPSCAGVLNEIRIAQRTTVFCKRCQR